MASTIDSDLEARVRLACADLERRLRQGEHCRVEQFFDAYPELAEQEECAIDLIYTEYLTRLELDQQAVGSDLFKRFPQWREYLEQQFAFHQRLEDSLPPNLKDEGGRMKNESKTENRSGSSLIPHPSSFDWPKHYELLEELGRGGMGVVYKARQVSLNRVVALKMMIYGNYAGPEDLARFHLEAEAAARLHHPNIVQIYEVGEQDGNPFLALEYVAGMDLAQYAASTPQPPRAAAELIDTLARAMHHAHQQGIVHRDLKPANILLATNGEPARPRELLTEAVAANGKVGAGAHDTARALAVSPLAFPKITDFGLAKCLDHDRQLTRTGLAVGTPNYMAPELAGGNVRATSPAVDIYSLGAILYQLLTGRPPFQGNTPLETLHRVRLTEAVPPRRLQPQVPRDLEVICLKCLEKEPGKRYADAQALAEDLRRFLAGEPIHARAVGQAERAWRWCRRNPVIASLLSLVVLTFLAGFAGMAWKWREAELQRDLVVEEQKTTATERNIALAAQAKAELAEKAAKKEAATSAAVFRYLVEELLLAAAPDSHHVRQLRVDDVLKSAVKNIDKELKDQPAIEASVRLALGESLLRLGNFADAKLQLEKARDLCLTLYGEEHKDTLLVLNDLAALAQDRGEFAEAEALYRKTLALQRRVLGDRAQATMRTMHNVASLLHDQARASEPYDDNKLAAAETLYRETLAIRRQELGADHPGTLNTTHLLALVLKDRGRRDEAEQLMRDNLDARRRKLPPGHPDIASSLLAIGRLLFDRSDYYDAERHLREAVAIYNGPSGLPADHWRTAHAESQLGGCLTALKRYEEAETLLIKAYEKLARGKGAPPPTVRGAWQRIIDLYAAWGKSEKVAEWQAQRP